MKLIVVTAPTFFVEEDKIITALFEEGLDILHLRKPETPAMYSERLLTLIPEKYHKRIITHEHFYLQEEFSLMGIHLTPAIPKSPTTIRPHQLHLPFTGRSAEQEAFHDYLFLSPIYNCITKSGVTSGFTAEELRQAGKSKVIDSRVMALGGITPDNILEIKDYGFGGAVVMGDLWNKFNACTDRDYLEVIRHFKKLKKMAD